MFANQFATSLTSKLQSRHCSAPIFGRVIGSRHAQSAGEVNADLNWERTEGSMSAWEREKGVQISAAISLPRRHRASIRSIAISANRRTSTLGSSSALRNAGIASRAAGPMPRSAMHALLREPSSEFASSAISAGTAGAASGPIAPIAWADHALTLASSSLSAAFNAPRSGRMFQIRYGWQASLRAPRQWAKTLAAARHSRSADVARIWYHLEVRVGRR